MKYSVETNENGYVETLEVDRRKYTKKWNKLGLAMRSSDDDFADQLEADGANEEFIEEVRNTIDDTFFGHDFYKML